jgi:hypothetical protein
MVKSTNKTKITFQREDELDFATIEFQKRKFQFLNELTCLLFTHRTNKEIGAIISELIVFTLAIQERYFLDKVYAAYKINIFATYELHDYLIVLKKIHHLLFQAGGLSDKKRLRFYRLERFCIKYYLDHSLSVQNPPYKYIL